MTRQPSRGPFFAILAIFSGLLVSCSNTSGKFIKAHPTYSFAAGQVVRIESMHTNEIEKLSDGRAITVSRPGCRVLLAFDEERSKLFEVEEGTIIVHGADGDYLLFPNNGVQERDPEEEKEFLDEFGLDLDLDEQ